MENGKERIFEYSELKVEIKVFLRADGYSSEKHKQYWFDNIEKILEAIG